MYYLNLVSVEVGERSTTQRVTCSIRPRRRSGTRNGQTREGLRRVEMRRRVTETKGYRREYEIIACTAIVENTANDYTFSEARAKPHYSR
ncbi:unnamed protein product, partial [Ceratitis capitata]